MRESSRGWMEKVTRRIGMGGVFIEDNGTDERKSSDRCFRFDANGNAEYTFFADLISNNPAPRWFGHVYKERDFLFA